MLQINYYTMQNIEANFPEPERFKPERWLGPASAAARAARGAADDDVSVERTDPLARAFLPYSAGPRSCIGQPLAQMEVRPFALGPAFSKLTILEVMWPRCCMLYAARKVHARVEVQLYCMNVMGPLVCHNSFSYWSFAAGSHYPGNGAGAI